MITFSTSWPPRPPGGRPPGARQKLIGVLLFCLTLGVVAVGAAVGAVLLLVGVLAASVSALAMAVRRSLGGGRDHTSVPSTTTPARHGRDPAHSSAGGVPRSAPGQSTLVIDVESVTDEPPARPGTRGN